LAAPPATHVAVAAATVPSALPAPVRDVPSLRREIAARSAGTYMEFLLLNNDSLVVRWPERIQKPVRVWIQPSSDLKGWTATMVPVAREAFGNWISGSLPVRFDFVADSASAEIIVTWQDAFEARRVGLTTRYRDQHGWLGKAHIAVALNTADGMVIDIRYIGAVVTHEVGHALGLDHSPSRHDLMAERNEGVFQPTTEDRSTLALIYSLPPGSIR
jgi:hypothetical protein